VVGPGLVAITMQVNGAARRLEVEPRPPSPSRCAWGSGSRRMVNANLDQYKIAGARETPAIRTIFVEHEQKRTSTEVNGLGEPANIATAAAIANAVYDATGVRMRRLPMSPPVVVATLAAAAASKKGGSAR
jgi:hypothetical protein